MNKKFSAYSVAWLCLLLVFNVACFLSPVEVEEFNKFGGSFWAGYIVITIAFIGQLITAFVAFKEKNIKKIFYRLSLISTSFAGLILTAIAGTAVMVVPDIPNYIGAGICLIVLLFNIIAVIKAASAVEIVEKVDENMKIKTQFIKLAIVDVENIMSRATTEVGTAACKKAYEALRYSDPVSNEALENEESAITNQISNLRTAVESGKEEDIVLAADKLVILIEERNKKCKILK